MSKVHPNYPAIEASVDGGRTGEAVAMTVWRKSLLFNCKGFTVFDAKGNLLYRVDNYSSSSRNEEIVLMNACGNCLFTIKRKRLSLCENWLIYCGEEMTNHRFSVKKCSSFLRSKVLALVTSSGPARSGRHAYSVEGSYSQNQCTIYDDRCRPVGVVKRKEAQTGIALGCDVFLLVVQPEMDPALAMAVVMILEQMYGSWC